MPLVDHTRNQETYRCLSINTYNRHWHWISGKTCMVAGIDGLLPMEATRRKRSLDHKAEGGDSGTLPTLRMSHLDTCFVMAYLIIEKQTRSSMVLSNNEKKNECT